MNGFRSSSNVVFFDILMNALIGFTALFVMAFIQIRPIEENKIESIDLEGEYVITVRWGDKLNDDVDTYVMDPLGHLVYFMRLEDGFMHLDRDDRGLVSDTIIEESGNEIKLEKNEENVKIRKIISGEYIVNVHMFRKASRGPVSVKVVLIKLRGQDQKVIEKTVVLSKRGDEKTAFRFSFTSSGEVENINFLQKSLSKAGSLGGR